MMLNLLRLALVSATGLALAGCNACSKTDKDKPAASAEAPQPLEKKAPPTALASGDAPRRRMDPASLVERFDTDKNGKVELSELPEKRRERLASADVNGDGVLSVEEIEKHRPTLGKGMRDQAGMMEHLDANKDGKLQASELPERHREKLMAADTNKDGALSSEELKAHIESRRSGGPSPVER